MSSTTGTSSLPAAERAYRHVKSRIIAGDYPDPTMLSEGEIATSLGVSRTPVREAFLRLEVEGFLKLYPKRGALVVPISSRDIHEVFEARLLVETKCAANICTAGEARRAEVVEKLEALIDAQESALAEHDLATYAEQDAMFHHTIMDNGENRILAQLGTSLRERQQRFTATAVGRSIETAERFVVSHRKLTDALAAGDAEAFAEALKVHLDESQSQL